MLRTPGTRFVQWLNSNKGTQSPTGLDRLHRDPLRSEAADTCPTLTYKSYFGLGELTDQIYQAQLQSLRIAPFCRRNYDREVGADGTLHQESGVAD